jgi:glycerol kinase
MPRILAVDQGTTGTAAFVFDERLRIRGAADQEFRQRFPRPGWVEHDAEEIWRTAQTVVARAKAKAGARGRSGVDAIGITNQRETVVAWDARSGKPLTRAIVWQDRRTADRCSSLEAEGLDGFLRDRTGLVTDPYFSATKMEWMLRNVPKVRRAEESGTLRFGTIDSWLVWKLTEGEAHVTDASNASRTLLYDLDRRDWSDELLDVFGIERSTLPRLVPSSGTLARAADGTPICGIAGDQQAALFGQACYRSGDAKSTYGTGSFVLMNTGPKRPVSPRLLATVAWDVDGKVEYALEGSVFTTGASVQWLRDELGFVRRASDTERLARSVPDTGGVRFLPALAGLAAPHWDPHARGALVGLTRGTTKAHLVRAVLEATAYRVAEVVSAMQEDSGVALQALRVDGGGSQNAFLMQLQSDLLGVGVERPRMVALGARAARPRRVAAETTALGAACLAALGCGVFSSRDEVAKAWHRDRRWTPRMRAEERARRLEEWRRFVDQARALYAAMRAD